MLLYNTTFHVEDEVEKNFLIWLNEVYIKEVEENGTLHSPRLCKILSHHDEGVCYSLQWEVETSAALHRWHLEQGARLNQQLLLIFKDKVVGIPTLMEVVR